MKKRLFSVLILVAMLTTFVSIQPVMAEEALGEACGDNLLWTLTEDGTLTISGNGDMWESTKFLTLMPWEKTGIPLKKIVVNSGVTSIGAQVFYSCRELTEVVLPETVVMIGDRAFKYCEALKSINLPDSIIRIGVEAFYVTGIEEINIPAGLEVIEALAFSATNLKKLTIPEGVTEIKKEAFGGCKDLLEIKFPSTLEVIHNEAFAWCESLTEITIPKGVKTIGAEAFTYCRKLTEINLPDGIENFGESNGGNTHWYTGLHAFLGTGYAQNKDNWENGILYIGDYLIDVETATEGKVTIKDGTKYITDKAFYRCKSITEVTLPDSVERIHFGAFDSCSALEKIITGNGIRYVGTDVLLGTAFINNEENYENGALYMGSCLIKAENGVFNGEIKEGTVCIGSNALQGHKELSKITLPQSLKHISDYAFDGCSMLDSVVLPGELVSIGISAFESCRMLKEIIMPDTVTELGTSAFAFCSSLGNLVISKGLEKIPDGAFGGCGMEELYIPDSVKSIGAGGFSGCENIKVLSMGAGVTFIDDYGFGGLSSIEEIIISDSVVTIGSEAFSSSGAKRIKIGKGLKNVGLAPFSYCHDLTEFDVSEENTVFSSEDGVLFNKDKTLLIHYPVGKEDKEYIVPDGVLTLGEASIYWTGKLERLVISDTVTRIESSAVSNGYELHEVILGKNVEYIGSWAFSNAWYLEEIIIPDSVKEIGMYAFSSNNRLGYVKLGKGLEKIGENAFAGCSISDISFPETLKSIGITAFEGCKNLESIRIPENVETIGENAFSNCSNLETIYVSDDNKFYMAEDDVLFTKDKKTLLLYAALRDEYTYTVPDGVENIADYAFYGCSILESIILPQGLLYIGEYAFGNSNSLLEIYIPESVIETGKANFVDNCEYFGTIYYGGNETQWHSIDFYDKLLDNPEIDIQYNYKYFSETIVVQCNENDTFIRVTPASEHIGKTLIVALYQDGKMTNFGTKVCENKNARFNFEEEHDLIKVMYWDSLEGAAPFAPVTVIETI